MPFQPGLQYLAEGGQETELMYKYGFDLPEFALFAMLEDERAVEALRGMYARFLDVAARHGVGALMGGLDYRASPDWATKLGYDAAGLAAMQHRAIDFLRDVAKPYESRIPSILIAGIVGPRGDAYAPETLLSAGEADEYHDVQLSTLVDCGVDLVEAMTFNAVDEAIGLTRAGARHRLPLVVLFIVDRDGDLLAGPSLREAIEQVDAATGDDRPAFYGINCAHPIEFEQAVFPPGPWFERVRCLRPNAALADKIALCTLGHLEAGDPVDLGERMGHLAANHPHLDVWGGCCGTWEDHLEEIARSVSAHRR